MNSAVARKIGAASGPDCAANGSLQGSTDTKLVQVMKVFCQLDTAEKAHVTRLNPSRRHPAGRMLFVRFSNSIRIQSPF